MRAGVDSGPKSALAHARLYRKLGYNVLPSRHDEKRPMVKFAHLWEEMAPAEWFSDQWFFDTGCLQIMTGRHWRLAVIDLDGQEAVDAWPDLRPLRAPSPPRTWESTSGGGGRHLWFTIPSSMCIDPMPKRLLWKGEGKHQAVEFLCDKSLVMAPPSIHPKTGRVYRFRAGHSPRDMSRPAYLPRWVIDLPSIEVPKPQPVAPSRPISGPPRKVLSGPLPNWTTRQEVLASVHDKAALAASWGLRFAARPCESNGWVSVHDFNREDHDPSARFHPEMGRFWRPGERTIGLFDLGVELGVYADWRDCCADLAATYLPHRVNRS